MMLQLFILSFQTRICEAEHFLRRSELWKHHTGSRLRGNDRRDDQRHTVRQRAEYFEWPRRITKHLSSLLVPTIFANPGNIRQLVTVAFSLVSVYCRGTVTFYKKKKSIFPCILHRNKQSEQKQTIRSSAFVIGTHCCMVLCRAYRRSQRKGRFVSMT